MRWLTFLLLTGVLLQTCSKELIFTEYLINREFIATVLCVNKNAPEKHCEGKCHLKKQLDKDDAQQGDQQMSKTGIEILFLVSGKLTINWVTANSIPHFFQYTESLSAGVPDTFFHPPGLFC